MKAVPPSLSMGKDLLHICRENPCPLVMGLVEITSKERGMIWIRRKWQGSVALPAREMWMWWRSTALVAGEVLQRGLELSENTPGVK